MDGGRTNEAPKCKGYLSSVLCLPSSTSREKHAYLSGFDIFVIAFVVLAILTLLAGVKTISKGYSWTVERFGRYTRTLKPGLATSSSPISTASAAR